MNVFVWIMVVFGLMNIGKMYYVIEWMFFYKSGVIGLFLWFLVCEVYDRIVKVCGLLVVVLIIGEEWIIFDCVVYWVCMVEVMFEGIGVEFLVIDEI